MSPTPRVFMPFELPFTHADLDARGLTYEALRGWLQRHECVRIGHGLYAPPHLADETAIRAIWSSRQVAIGAMAVSPHAAALVHKLAIPPRLHASTRRPIPLHELPENCHMRSGRLVIPSLEWTAILLARGQDLPGALIVFDSAARLGLDVDLLANLYCRTTRWPGVAKIGAAINEMNAASESPLESAARGWLIEHGFPAPVLQQRFSIAGRNYFVDFYWPESRVILEADGLVKYEDSDELRRERRRQSALDSTGCRVLRIGWHDLERTPEQLHRTLVSALR